MGPSVLQPFLIIAASYLIGSIPFGLLLTRFAGLGDIRHIGSGNIGATNVLRTGNKGLAALTLLLDYGKGFAAVGLAEKFYPEITALAGLAVVLGHMFPVWLKFAGGKGMATSAGVITALAWPAGILTMALWVIVLWRSRVSSLAALAAIGLAPLDIFLFGRGDIFWVVLIIAALVFWKHRENIKRLLDGTEPKITED